MCQFALLGSVVLYTRLTLPIAVSFACPLFDGAASFGVCLALLASVTTPTLVMDGRASPAFMHKAAQAATHYLPNARHRRLPEQTHNVDPEVLAPVLAEFFAG